MTELYQLITLFQLRTQSLAQNGNMAMSMKRFDELFNCFRVILVEVNQDSMQSTDAL